MYLLPNGKIVMAALVAPGLIVYQYARSADERKEVEADAKDAARYLAYYLIAALVIGAGLRGRRLTSGERSVDAFEESVAIAQAFGALTDDLPSNQSPNLVVVLALGVLAAGVAAGLLMGVEELAGAIGSMPAIAGLVLIAQRLAPLTAA